MPCHNGCACSLTVFCLGYLSIWFLFIRISFRKSKWILLGCLPPHFRIHGCARVHRFCIKKHFTFHSLDSSFPWCRIFAVCLAFSSVYSLSLFAGACVFVNVWSCMPIYNCALRLWRAEQCSINAHLHNSNQLNLVQPYNTIATYIHNFSVLYILGT